MRRRDIRHHPDAKQKITVSICSIGLLDCVCLSEFLCEWFILSLLPKMTRSITTGAASSKTNSGSQSQQVRRSLSVMGTCSICLCGGVCDWFILSFLPKMTRSIMTGAASKLSSHVLCKAMVLCPPSKNTRSERRKRRGRAGRRKRRRAGSTKRRETTTRSCCVCLRIQPRWQKKEEKPEELESGREQEEEESKQEQQDRQT